MAIDLSLIWVLIIAFGLMMYVIMDGSDLGIGILFPFVPRTGDRDIMINTVAPVWDGNETWLVLGGAGLMAAFPLAYSVLLSALYIPIVMMLLGLILRGVAFEFRFKADKGHSAFWSWAFACGSYAAAFFQGAALGAFIDGFTVTGPSYQGGALDWLSPFSVFTGLGVIVSYALLGSTWLTMKTEGELQAWSRRAGRICLIGVGVAVVAVSIWTPLVDPEIARRWFSWPNILWLSPVPIVTAAIAALCWRSLGGRGEALPFLSAIALFLMSFVGITISLWPMIVPHHYTLMQAASSPGTQAFLLVGTLFLLPVILVYSGWSYWVFRGKVRADVGYH